MIVRLNTNPVDIHHTVMHNESLPFDVRYDALKNHIYETKIIRDYLIRSCSGKVQRKTNKK